MDSGVIRDICLYLQSNINNNVSLEEIENNFNYNKYYIVREFKNYTGYTLIDYLNNYRIYNSVDELIYTDDTILKIALNNGFNSQEYYSEIFKKIIGLSPLKLRKMIDFVEKIDNTEYLQEIKNLLNNIENKKNIIYNLHNNIENNKVKKLTA